MNGSTFAQRRASCDESMMATLKLQGVSNRSRGPSALPPSCFKFPGEAWLEGPGAMFEATVGVEALSWSSLWATGNKGLISAPGLQALSGLAEIGSPGRKSNRRARNRLASLGRHRPPRSQYPPSLLRASLRSETHHVCSLWILSLLLPVPPFSSSSTFTSIDSSQHRHRSGSTVLASSSLRLCLRVR